METPEFEENFNNLGLDIYKDNNMIFTILIAVLSTVYLLGDAGFVNIILIDYHQIRNS